MADDYYKLEDEVLPCVFGESMDSFSGRATLGNSTLGLGLGQPVAVSTVARMRSKSHNREDPRDSCLDDSELKPTSSRSSVEQHKFSLSFKDELDKADDFIAAHNISDMLVKINLDESAPQNQGPAHMRMVHNWPTELATDMSTGLLTLTHFGLEDSSYTKASAATVGEYNERSEADDSSSKSSFLENERLMSVDSMNSDITDDDTDLNNLPDHEVKLHSNELFLHRRGRVEGQEIPSSEDYRMPEVRLAATGMDSCPASDEDTEDELESSRRNNNASRTRLLPSTTRQLVGGSNRSSFRPGLEGGSSESFGGRNGPSVPGIEHRRSAEGQGIHAPPTGAGGGGDGSSASEESGNYSAVSTIPPPKNKVPTTYDALRGLGIVGSSAAGENEDDELNNLVARGRISPYRHTEMGDRVGPVGTGAASSTLSPRPPVPSSVNWSMILGRQEALDAMESGEPESTVDRLMDSVYLKCGSAVRRPQDTVSHLQCSPGSFHLSQVLHSECNEEKDDDDSDGVDEPDGAMHSLGPRGGPCGNANTAEDLASANEDDLNPLSTSLEPKYFSQSFHQEQEDSDEWNHCPDNLELDFQQGANTTHTVVYQNEEGQWVTDLAYYSSFEKEVNGNVLENTGQFQTEDFVCHNDALEKIVKDQEEFENENQFIQEEEIEPANPNCTFQGDSSWKVPNNSQILMRASQVSSEFVEGEHSYRRLSLGEFIGQRSEALGCLGSWSSLDAIKRPSFGYIINSPEKREPFALIDPTQLSDTAKSHNDTIELSETDKTLNAEDLDKTLEAPGDIAAESSEPEDHFVPGATPDHSEGSGSESILGNQTLVTPDDNNSSKLMLSISTIASAIADASLSTDPSQLAAMIMALSKRSKENNLSTSELVRPVGHNAQEMHSTEQILSEPEHNPLLDTLQTSTHVGEFSAFDLEKYLKSSHVSDTSDTSVAHTIFDLTSLAHNGSKSSPTGYSEDQSSSFHQVDNYAHKTASAANLSNSVTVVNQSEPIRTHPRCNSATKTCESKGKTLTENGVKPGAQYLSTSSSIGSSVDPSTKNIKVSSTSTGSTRAPPGWREGQSCSSLPSQREETTDQQHQGRLDGFPLTSEEKHVAFSSQNIRPFAELASEATKDFPEPFVEETLSNFRPSTSPLTQSSPSQTTIPCANGVVTPIRSNRTLTEKSPGLDYSPHSTCSSPSLSRLTYISMNDVSLMPSLEKEKNNCSMALSTTIVRFSPTPPVEADEKSNTSISCPPKSLDEVQPQHSKSVDRLPVQQYEGLEPRNCGSALSCAHNRSDCNCHSPRQRTCDLATSCRPELSQPTVNHLNDLVSGYTSNLNFQSTRGPTVHQSSHQWKASGGPGVPTPSYSSPYVPIPTFKPQCAGYINVPHRGDVQSFLAGCLVYNPQLAQQYLGSEAPLYPGLYPAGPSGSCVYSVSSTASSNNNQAFRHIHPTSVPLGSSSAVVSHHLQHQSQREIMEKPYNYFDMDPQRGASLGECRGQVVVPGEVRFPHSCCVGIASQTSLSLFNPSEIWQQVSITVTNLTIDGKKVDELPYQCLIVKSKTIIGPKNTEEQMVLFMPPRAGVYHFILNICSWPVSADTEAAARANILAKSVVLVAIAENPALEVEEVKSCGLDFGDLPGGSTKSLPLKVVNKTCATVPIRLVVSANTTSCRCFTISQTPGMITPEPAQQAGHMTPISSSPVMSHVMAASNGDKPASLMMWVHFKAPQKYTFSGELGQADEYFARVDIELDSPGPSHVVLSVPLSARSGTARVHAPKDLQTLTLSAPLGQSVKKILPLKNAGNIDVQLKLEGSDAEGSFSVTPDELFLTVGDQKDVAVSFKAQGLLKIKERANVYLKQDDLAVKESLVLNLLTILVLPSGPQYEVTLKGEMIPEDSGKPLFSSSPALGSDLTNDIPPILSNKQFIAWGGVSLGQAVQKKLVLRNNSRNITQQLRLLIRGQDQDCFQLQSMFSPEERLSRHGELSIHPKEDVTVHLLFAPTRVACMLAKLDIKQSGVWPSQPGMKFTIPLSGYGGTSNIILEDQRKQADSYVATLTDVAIGQISKVCLCVRNTGSRAAFIKAVAYSDVPTRSVLEPSVISLEPSQFVLKERTQEVITVIMTATQREERLCQSVTAPLATVFLFCGDEVSRQRYRRLLQNKPAATRNVLSENGLLKNINFNEKYLGEELVTETCDLPFNLPFANEAQIFYANSSMVMVSLMGSSNNTTSLPSSRRSSDAVSVVKDSVSLDELPVKGPQGPTLRVTESPLMASEPSYQHSGSWTLHPEQLVLTTPSTNGEATFSQIQIHNNTSRTMTFDLSWPAHCLTITPEHGEIEPKCHLQILISPNPSMATKSALLPWSGQVYVQCDGQQKIIKVQIRQDLALDISAAPSERTLFALSPHAATPVNTVSRLPTEPSAGMLQMPETCQALVEIGDKTILFPTTPSGDASEAHLEVQNGAEEVRWYLSSFAPPYVKRVDNTADVYRATYTAFRCARVSGTLGAKEKILVPITFLPRDGGDYAQFWDLECHPLSDPQQKTRLRFQLCGTGVKAGPVERPGEGDNTVVRTEPSAKIRKKTGASSGKNSQEEAVCRGLYSPQELYTFPATHIGGSNSQKVSICNNSPSAHELSFLISKEPFFIKHSKYSLRSQNYVKLRVQFKPRATGRHTGVLLIQSDTSASLVIHLMGEAVP